MCNPYIAAAAVAMQFIGNKQAGEAQANAANFDASIARQNATIAEQAARDARAAGHEAESAYLQRVAGLTGQQRATFAANGVEQSGTALDVMAESAGQGAADASRIRSNAIREAWGYQNEADQYRQKAKFSRYSAKVAKQGGILTGATQGLGTGYQLLGK